MANPVEFGSFYKLLREARDGNDEKNKELQWMLAEYEHAKESKNAYDELGQIFCHIGVMQLYEYTGTDNIPYISKLDKLIWDYLKVRTGEDLLENLIRVMTAHAEEHNLSAKVSRKWEIPKEEVEENIEPLARYVSEGIIEIIK